VYGSRGQQRLGALAVKQAEADHLEEQAGSRPVLLMDDVLSELDRERQEAVQQFVLRKGQETVLTTTSLEYLNAELRAAALIWSVKEGAVSEYHKGQEEP
jgi:DNA replication and repair protein RecF